MKKPRFFKKIILSMNSKEFYMTIIHEHFMKSFLYLVLFCLLISLPFSIYASIKTSNKITLIAKDFPAFTIQNGELKLENNEPYIYTDSDKMILIVDTSDTYTFNDLAGYEAGYLMTKSSVIIPQKGFSPQIIKYSDFPFLSLSKIDLNLFVLMQPLMVVISILFNLFGALILALLKSLFISSVSYFIKNGFGLSLKFSQTYKIAIYSMTAPLVFVEILHFIPTALATNISFSLFAFISIVNLVQVFRYMKNQKTDISI